MGQPKGSIYTCQHGEETKVFSPIEHRHCKDGVICPSTAWGADLFRDRR